MRHAFVILAYKESPFLEACILSCINQRVQSEVIISTSTPNNFISGLAKKHDLQIAENKTAEKSIANDWNFALSVAKTKYVTLAHQDDIYLPDFVELKTKKMNRTKNCLISFSNYAELKNETIIKHNPLLIVKRFFLIPFYLKSSHKNPFLKKTPILFGSSICCPSVTFNMENEEMKGFNFNNTFSINMDWDAWYRLAQKEGSFVFVKKFVMFHRIHADAETSKGIKDNRRANEDKLMFNTVYRYRLVANTMHFFYQLSYQFN